MAEALEPATTGTGGVAFELDRFEMAGGDRLEVNGRWFGVRGRRFMRPSLTLVADEDQRRLLADLEHKPWAAEDGQPWEAAFPYDEQDGGWLEAELNVAPDIMITLPLPGAGPGATAAGRRRRDGRTQAPTARRPRKRAAERADTPAELARTRRELDQLRAELERRDARLAELTAQLEQVSTDQDAARKAGRLAEEEREQFTRARDEALSARDEALAERGNAMRARDEVAAELETALSAHSRAAAELDSALAACDEATADRDALVAARDGAIASHKRAVAERDALSTTIEQLRSERDDAMSQRGAALVMRNAASTPPSYRRDGNRILHFLPALIVLAVAVVIALALHLI